MNNITNAPHPYAILLAAITGTLPTDWMNPQGFSWQDNNIEAAPAGPHYGYDVFAINALTHKDGQVGRVCYDLLDYVYVDFGELRWSGPLEDRVHFLATWELDFEAAALARQEELARAPAPAQPHKLTAMSV